ncbi:hypothetical protein [Legionella sp. WA2022007384]
MHPIDKNRVIWWPGAFTKASQHQIRNAIEVIDVTEQEVRKFWCNAIVCNEHIIIPAGCDLLRAELEKMNFKVSSCDMSEFIKVGGLQMILLNYVFAQVMLNIRLEKRKK